MRLLLELWKCFILVLYPNYCRCCGSILNQLDEIICFDCRLKLPYTDFHKTEGNPVEKLFYGRVIINSATTMFRFRKEGSVQLILHSLKYHNDPLIGIVLGKQYGKVLSIEKRFSSCTMIIPVPLHPLREKKRGYNQSQKFAEGLAQSMQIPVCSDVLLRKYKTETQTRKSAFKRWENVKAVFMLDNRERLINQHVIIVDDVITTGSTIEACIQLLLEEPTCKISLVGIALAGHSL